VTGTAFGTNTGLAGIEVVDNVVYASGAKVSQNIDTWADTSIQIDITIGILDVESLWLYVTDSAGNVSDGYAVTVELTPVVTDVDGDEAIDADQLNVVITGEAFFPTQDTGKVELSDTAVYATGTNVTPTIDHGGNNAIQYEAHYGA